MGTMPKTGSKKRARESSPAVKKKKEVPAEEEETDASAEGEEKVAEDLSESAPLLVFAHGAGANSSHEWMVRYALFCRFCLACSCPV